MQNSAIQGSSLQNGSASLQPGSGGLQPQADSTIQNDGSSQPQVDVLGPDAYRQFDGVVTTGSTPEAVMPEAAMVSQSYIIIASIIIIWAAVLFVLFVRNRNRRSATIADILGGQEETALIQGGTEPVVASELNETLLSEQVTDTKATTPKNKKPAKPNKHTPQRKRKKARKKKR